MKSIVKDSDFLWWFSLDHNNPHMCRDLFFFFTKNIDVLEGDFEYHMKFLEIFSSCNFVIWLTHLKEIKHGLSGGCLPFCNSITQSYDQCCDNMSTLLFFKMSLNFDIVVEIYLHFCFQKTSLGNINHKRRASPYYLEFLFFLMNINWIIYFLGVNQS